MYSTLLRKFFYATFIFYLIVCYRWSGEGGRGQSKLWPAPAVMSGSCYLASSSAACHGRSHKLARHSDRAQVATSRLGSLCQSDRHNHCGMKYFILFYYVCIHHKYLAQKDKGWCLKIDNTTQECQAMKKCFKTLLIKSCKFFECINCDVVGSKKKSSI